jgi:hypothetical protein
VEFSASLNNSLAALGLRKPFEGGDLTGVRCCHTATLPCRTPPCPALPLRRYASCLRILCSSAAVFVGCPTTTATHTRTNQKDSSLLFAPLLCVARPLHTYRSCLAPHAVQIAEDERGNPVDDLYVSAVLHKVYAKARTAMALAAC